MQLDSWPPNTPYTPETLTFQWQPGKKASDDQRLEIRNGDRWVPISMVDIAFAFEHLAHNEDRLYPPPKQGWLKWRNFLRLAYVKGWSYARTQMHEERKNRQQRLEGDL